MKKALAIDVGGTCLDLFALNGNSVFCFKELCFFRKSTPASARSRCLGFAPRSESFAIEPSVQVCSISSLSGLTSCRPYANPLNPMNASHWGSTSSERLLKTIEALSLIILYGVVGGTCVGLLLHTSLSLTYILLSQNCRSFASCFFELGSLCSPSLYAKSSEPA